MTAIPLLRSAASIALLWLGAAGAIAQTTASARATSQPARALSCGPIVGHVSPTSASIWVRTTTPGEISLDVLTPDSKVWKSIVAVTTPQNDSTKEFTIDGCTPATEYTYRVTVNDEPIAAGQHLRFRTPALPDQPAKVTLAFGSCANSTRFPKQPIWNVVGGVHPDALFLIGDTPYIDSTDLAVQREKYRGFFNIPEFARVLSHTPTYGVWDDHDFGRNDTTGKLKGRENSLRAFREYHANPSYGDGAEGIYTNVRIGPAEVFLIDARWFAATERSFADAEKPTLIGKRQWEWLRAKLKASDAPFKILTTGMVWNEFVRAKKTDMWTAYPHERAAVFKFIADEKITGVILMGGDIHRCRALVHPPSETGVAYDLLELVASPLANDTHPPIASPLVIFDANESQNFVALTADSTITPPTLMARFFNHESKELFRYEVTADKLRP